MTTGRAGFWAGVALGVTTGVAALYGVLKVWAKRWPTSEEESQRERWNADHPDPMFRQGPEGGFTVGGSGHQDHVHGLFGEKALTTSDWCPGVDPSEDGRRVAGRLQASGNVTWALCGDWLAHEPHLRATDPEYVAPPVPEIWCRGIDSIHPSAHEPQGPVRWDQCTVTIRHNMHRRYDKDPGYLFHAPVDPEDPEERELHGEPEWISLGTTDEGFHGSASVEDVRASFDSDPGTGAACVHHASESCPEGLSFGEHLHDPEGCHAGGRPHTGPCFTVIDHTLRWALAYGEAMHPPVIDPEVMKNFKAQLEEALRSVGEVGPAFRKVTAPAADALAAAMSPATPTDLVQCWRDYPHTEHVHVDGICRGRTPEETDAPLYRLHDQGLPHPAHGMPWLEACPNCPGVPEPWPDHETMHGSDGETGDGLVANVVRGHCGQWFEHDQHRYMTDPKTDQARWTRECMGVRRG